MSGNLQNAIVELNEEVALSLVKERIEAGEEPESIIEALSSGMQTVADRFEREEYGLAELHMASEIYNESVKLVESKFKAPPVLGKIVLGQAAARLKDYGREAVAGVLKASGFEVYDLGEDVSGERFAAKAREVNADVVAICGLQSTNVEAARSAVSEIRASGATAKILVGPGISCGCQIVVDDKMRQMVGADAAWNRVREAVDLAKSVVKKQEEAVA